MSSVEIAASYKAKDCSVWNILAGNFVSLISVHATFYSSGLICNRSIAASCAKMIIFNFVGHQLEGQPDVSCTYRRKSIFSGTLTIYRFSHTDCLLALDRSQPPNNGSMYAHASSPFQKHGSIPMVPIHSSNFWPEELGVYKEL